MNSQPLYASNTTVRLAVLVVLLVCISAAAMLAILHKTNRSAAVAALQEQLETNAQLITHQLELYQQIVHDLSRRTEVRDLLNVGSTTEAHDWAIDRRDNLPNSIGLALVSHEGVVLGNPTTLKLGEACVTDLNRLRKHEAIAEPPVHLENPRLAHFDLVQSVTGDDGHQVGLVFASFTLDILSNSLESLVRPGQRIGIRDGQGRLLVEAGLLRPQEQVLHAATRVPGTDWQLEVHSAPDLKQQAAFRDLVITTLVITVVLITVVGGFGWRVSHHRHG